MTDYIKNYNSKVDYKNTVNIQVRLSGCHSGVEAGGLDPSSPPLPADTAAYYRAMLGLTD